jgi:hypothetical protein
MGHFRSECQAKINNIMDKLEDISGMPPSLLPQNQLQNTLGVFNRLTLDQKDEFI